jgi:hypothetical protein
MFRNIFNRIITSTIQESENNPSNLRKDTWYTVYCIEVVHNCITNNNLTLDQKLRLTEIIVQLENLKYGKKVFIYEGRVIEAFYDEAWQRYYAENLMEGFNAFMKDDFDVSTHLQNNLEDKTFIQCVNEGVPIAETVQAEPQVFNPTDSITKLRASVELPEANCKDLGTVDVQHDSVSIQPVEVSPPTVNSNNSTTPQENKQQPEQVKPYIDPFRIISIKRYGELQKQSFSNNQSKKIAAKNLLSVAVIKGSQQHLDSSNYLETRQAIEQKDSYLPFAETFIEANKDGLIPDGYGLEDCDPVYLNVDRNINFGGKDSVNNKEKFAYMNYVESVLNNKFLTKEFLRLKDDKNLLRLRRKLGQCTTVVTFESLKQQINEILQPATTAILKKQKLNAEQVQKPSEFINHDIVASETQEKIDLARFKAEMIRNLNREQKLTRNQECLTFLQEMLVYLDTLELTSEDAKEIRNHYFEYMKLKLSMPDSTNLKINNSKSKSVIGTMLSDLGANLSNWIKNGDVPVETKFPINNLQDKATNIDPTIPEITNQNTENNLPESTKFEIIDDKKTKDIKYLKSVLGWKTFAQNQNIQWVLEVYQTTNVPETMAILEEVVEYIRNKIVVTKAGFDNLPSMELGDKIEVRSEMIKSINLKILSCKDDNFNKAFQELEILPEISLDIERVSRALEMEIVSFFEDRIKKAKHSDKMALKSLSNNLVYNISKTIGNEQGQIVFSGVDHIFMVSMAFTEIKKILALEGKRLEDKTTDCFKVINQLRENLYPEFNTPKEKKQPKPFKSDIYSYMQDLPRVF